MSETIVNLSLDLVDEPRYLLRPVLRQSVEYLELRTSIEKNGLLTAVLVRPINNRFRLVAGNWRRTACLELRRETIPAIVREMTDTEEIALQLQENAVRFETKPAEYANQLRRLLEQSPGMTAYDLAALVAKSAKWIKGLLNISYLDSDTQLMVDRGMISVHNAMMLAKMPPPMRKKHLDNACEMTVPEFKPLAAQIIKEHTEQIRQGRLNDQFTTEFKPVGYARSRSDVEAELAKPSAAALNIVAENCHTLLEAWQAGLRWGWHLDKESVEKRRRKAELQGRLESEGDDPTD